MREIFQNAAVVLAYVGEDKKHRPWPEIFNRWYTFLELPTESVEMWVCQPLGLPHNARVPWRITCVYIIWASPQVVLRQLTNLSPEYFSRINIPILAYKAQRNRNVRRRSLFADFADHDFQADWCLLGDIHLDYRAEQSA